jgi:predicted esterase
MPPALAARHGRPVLAAFTTALLARPAGHHHRGRGGTAIAAMRLDYPRPTIVPPRTSSPTAVVFMLHGLGDTAAGWTDVAHMLRDVVPHAKWVLPTAPTRPITLNGGMPMPGWYDITSLESIAGREDRGGLAETRRYVASLIAAEVAAGVPSDRIVVAGFSQGAAAALMTLRDDAKLAGVVALSGYLPLAGDGAASPANGATPVLMCHGDADAVVAYRFGTASRDAVVAAGLPVEFKAYAGMGHSACPEELRDVGDFLEARLPPLK